MLLGILTVNKIPILIYLNLNVPGWVFTIELKSIRLLHLFDFTKTALLSRVTFQFPDGELKQDSEFITFPDILEEPMIEIKRFIKIGNINYKI